MDVLRCIVLGLHSSHGPGKFNGTEEEYAGPFYAVCFQQPAQPAPDGEDASEEEKGHAEAGEQGSMYRLVAYREIFGKDGQEMTSNLQTQHQVGTRCSVRLMLFDTIFSMDPSFLLPNTFLIRTPKQSLTSWNVVVHYSMCKYSGKLGSCEVLNYWQVYLAALLESTEQ